MYSNLEVFSGSGGDVQQLDMQDRNCGEGWVGIRVLGVFYIDKSLFKQSISGEEGKRFFLL